MSIYIIGSFKTFLFIYLFWTVLGLCCCISTVSSCGKQSIRSSCDAQASYRSDFSCCRAGAPEHRLDSCGAQA